MSQGFPVPPAPPPGPMPPGAVMTRPTNQMAIVSLVAGIAGYVIPHPFIAGIVAIVTGHMARNQIRQTGEEGSGLATAGLILGYVHLALSILLVIGIVIFVIFVIAVGAHSRTITQ